MKLLSLSIFSNETSLRAVEGTPSSCICFKATFYSHKQCPILIALLSVEKKRRRVDIHAAHLQASLLQGYQSSCGFVSGFVDLAIGTFSNFLKLLVLIHLSTMHLWSTDHGKRSELASQPSVSNLDDSHFTVCHETLYTDTHREAPTSLLTNTGKAPDVIAMNVGEENINLKSSSKCIRNLLVIVRDR